MRQGWWNPFIAVRTVVCFAKARYVIQVGKIIPLVTKDLV
jgi:hypothetical protein